MRRGGRGGVSVWFGAGGGVVGGGGGVGAVGSVGGEGKVGGRGGGGGVGGVGWLLSRVGSGSAMGGCPFLCEG